MLSRSFLLVAAAGAVLAAGGCVVPTAPVSAPRAARRVALPEQLLVRSAAKVVRVDLEAYVVDTILSEVSPVGEAADVVDRILEVQSVIARTYAVAKLGRHRADGFDLCDSTHCQLYQPARRASSRFAAAAMRAASRTASMVLTYDSQPIEALFHADCGGMTASAAAVWGGNHVPYLLAADDDLPEPTHRPWRVTANRDQLRAALNADPRTSVGRRLESITVATRDASGRAAGLSVRGERTVTVRGDVLRAVINRALGDRALLSTLFTIQTKGSDYVFTGTGFGHGVGLCQRGAATRLRRGERMEDVLELYYPGTRLAHPGP
jgi:stage II sporulation protein D